MRIIAGAWRGRRLEAPPGETTRPTADRVRQAVFDRLMHAPWAGRAAVDGATVLDAFAGTGAMGLEALSRGAGRAVFMEKDRRALAFLHGNVAACGAAERCRVLPCDVLRPPGGERCGVVFLDPPYAAGLLDAAVAALRGAGWVGAGSLLVMEMPRDAEAPAVGEEVARFSAGVATVVVVRAG